MKNKVIFRADGNSNIGLGHVIRSLAIADMIKEDFDCVFAIKNPSKQVKEIILEICKDIVVLEDVAGEDEFVNIVFPGVIVVLDSYSFKTDLQEKIKNKKSKLVCIDDLHAWHFVADAVINQDGNINETGYSKEPYTKLFMGFDYAMLRKPFLEAAKEQRPIRKTERIIINFGGADANNLTLKALETCLRIEQEINIHIITGAAYPHLNTLNKFRQQPNIIFHTQLNAREMCQIMQACELIICPSSSVCIEALSTGLNIITGYYADNQKEFAHFLAEQHYATSVGDFLTIAISQLEDIINKAIKSKSTHSAAKVIDGNQAARFVNLFQSLT